MKTEIISVQNFLSEEEINTKAKELANNVAKKATLQEEKKTAMSSFKAEIDAVDKVINELSGTINRGFEWENMECRYEDDEETGTRVCYDMKTGDERDRKPIPQNQELPFSPGDENGESEINIELVKYVKEAEDELKHLCDTCTHSDEIPECMPESVTFAVDADPTLTGAEADMVLSCDNYTEAEVEESEEEEA